jgi:hypothetical protein
MIRLLAATVLAVVSGGLVVATPAAAAPDQTVLAITITPLPGGMPSTPRYAVLTCDPAGGTHPKAAQACDEIAAAGGDIAAVPPNRNMGCLPVWEPVTIAVRGIWRGAALDYAATQGAVSCAMISHGAVFMIPATPIS